MRRTIFIFVFISLTLFTAACSDNSKENEEDVCTYDGQTFEIGDSFPSTDGCNTCTCGENGAVGCTQMGCVAICEYNDVVYQQGDTFMENGCLCSCGADGQVSCNEEGCDTFCEYGGKYYSSGNSFEASDGCNTCTCGEDGNVFCTEMACPDNDKCSDGLTYHETGCGLEEGMPEIEAGCYGECQGIPCESGICQLTDTNPCICEPGMDCCDACGVNTWLCLDAPQTCAPTAGRPIITSAGKSFGMCVGNCVAKLTIDPGDPGSCAEITLSKCPWNDPSGCAANKIAVLSATGQAKATGLAAELLGIELQETYGCPDCTDGGASQLTLHLDNKELKISYEYDKPPSVLARVDEFTQGLIEAMETCTPNDDIETINPGCISE
jgi:hypothetical protein